MSDQGKKNPNFNENMKKERELSQFKRPVKPIYKNSQKSNSLNEEISSNNDKIEAEKYKNKEKSNKNKNLEGTAVYRFNEKNQVKSIKPINKDQQGNTQKVNLDDIKINKTGNSANIYSKEVKPESPESFEKKNVDSKTKSISGDEIKKYYQEKNDKKFATKDVEITYRNKERDNEPAINKLAKITVLNSAKNDVPFINRLKRKGPNKRYRLKGFANKEYAKQVRKNKQNYMKWANRIFWILIAIILLIIFYFIDPLARISALRHMLGMD